MRRPKTDSGKVKRMIPGDGSLEIESFEDMVAVQIVVSPSREWSYGLMLLPAGSIRSRRGMFVPIGDLVLLSRR